MHRFIVTVWLVSLAACLAQGRLLKYWDFEDETDIQVWPEDFAIELDDEFAVAGRRSIVFTPDNNFVAYFYQEMTGGHRYRLRFFAKLSAVPIERVAVAVAFAKAGGGNGSAGRVSFPFAKLAADDNEWHECVVEFTAPTEAVKAQVMLSMYRSSVEVFIDELTFHDLSVPGTQETYEAVKAELLAKRARRRVVTTMPPLTTKRPFLPRKQSGYAFASNIEQIGYVVPGLRSMIHFLPVNPSKKPRLFIALPSSIRLTGGFRDFTIGEPVEQTIGGLQYIVYPVIAFPRASKYTFFWEGDASLLARQQVTGYYWGEWDGGKQTPQQLRIQVVELPVCAGFKELPVYLSMPNDFFTSFGELSFLKKQGFNHIDIWTYLNPEEKAWGMKLLDETNQLAKAAGLSQIAWIREWWWEKGKNTKEGMATKLDGVGTASMLCLSYRGEHYQQLLAQGRYLIDKGYYFHSTDPEMYSDARGICFCEKCKEAFREYLARQPGSPAYRDPVEIVRHQKELPELFRAWCAFKCQRYADFFGDYRREMERYMAEKGINVPFRFMVYSSYHRSFPGFSAYKDYRESRSYLQTLEDPASFNGVFDFLAPMIYTDVYANYGDYDMQLPWRDTRTLRQISGDTIPVAPILCAGYPFIYAFGSDNNAEMLKYNMLEALAGGAKGFGFWGECPFDANDAKSVAEVVAMLAPYEEILLKGTTEAPVQVPSANAIVRRTALGNRSLLFVSEYSRRNLTVEIECPVAVASIVRNLTTGKVLAHIKPDQSRFEVPMNAERVVVLAVEEE